MIDDDPWCVGKDVAVALGYSNPSKAVVVHVDGEDKRFVMVDIADSQNGNVPVGQTKTAIINESGLYSLILSSKLPTAKRFKHWVTSEVLPAIRKTGRYEMEAPVTPTRYRATRPLTTDDYEDAARTIAKCHNSRLPLVIDLYRKAGLDIQQIPVEEPAQPAEGPNKADFVKMLNRYSLKDLCERLPIGKTSIYYYRKGTHFPHPDRLAEIIQILEG